ncbi:MAG: hypothetical protein ACTSR3_22285, partial [Candidatus Helarchaeota archaeon]
WLMKLFYSVEKLKVLDMMAYITTCASVLNKSEKSSYIFGSCEEDFIGHDNKKYHKKKEN